MARGKLTQDQAAYPMHRPIVLTTTATYGDGIDTYPYRDAKIILNVGTDTGPYTLSAKLYGNDLRNVDGAVPVTGGAFPVITTASGNAVFLGHSQGHPRFLWLRLQASAPGAATIPISATCEIGRSNQDPSNQSVSFDIGNL